MNMHLRGIDLWRFVLNLTLTLWILWLKKFLTKKINLDTIPILKFRKGNIFSLSVICTRNWQICIKPLLKMWISLLRKLWHVYQAAVNCVWNIQQVLPNTYWKETRKLQSHSFQGSGIVTSQHETIINEVAK